MTDYDLVVVGSGAAGLSAALEAAAADVTVLLVEGETVLGGTSRLSGGIILACDSQRQRAAGIYDPPERFEREFLAAQRWTVDAGIAHRLAYESGPAADWLEGLGVRYSDDLLMAADHPAPRGHVPLDGSGQEVIDLLVARLRDYEEVDIALSRRVDRLLVEDSRVVGVSVGDDKVRTNAVILATGGLGASPELLAEHFPTLMLPGGWSWYIGAAGSRGDALGLAAQVEAEIVGHDCGHIDLRPNFYRDVEAHLPGWLVLIDGRGRRVCDEAMTCSAVEAVIRRAEAPIHAVFDEAAKQAATPQAARAAKKDAPETQQQRHDWIEPTIDAMVALGRVHRADTLAELADRIHVPATNLKATIDTYNAGVDSGLDPTFLKDSRFLRAVRIGPFYASELRLAMLAMTAMGPKIDADARVLDTTGRSVPGLFAAGECSGGVMGEHYFGHGASWTSCLVFGRTAGREAAHFAVAAV